MNPPMIPSGAEKPAGPSVAPAGADRRTHPRYEFIAAVEVIAAESGARIETRVRDLSQQGCYVDTNNALPLGTVTDVRITKGAQLFEAQARVVYSRASKGMGLVFTAIEPEPLRILETWLVESRDLLAGGEPPKESAGAGENPGASFGEDRHRIAF